MQFARLVIDLLLLRRGPQDIPGSATVVYAGAIAYCILLFVQGRMIVSAGGAGFQALVATGVLIGYTIVLLRYRGYGNRVMQTLASLFISGAIIKLLMLGPSMSFAQFYVNARQANSLAELQLPSPFITLAYLILVFWGIAVTAHIYRHALQGSFWLGLGAAFGYELLLLFVFSIIGPVG